MKRIIFFIAVTYFLSHPLYSGAAQVSGYISLKFLNGYTYKATVVDYTVGNPEDNGYCGVNTDLDSILINWGDGTSGYLYRSNGNIYPPNPFPGGDSVCDCRKMSVYAGAHTFPGSGVYRVQFNGGNRIAGIKNMTNSPSQDFYIYNTLNISSIAGDTVSSPSISNTPACTHATVGKNYFFNLGAAPFNTDSLSFTLGNCSNAAGYFLPPNVTLNPVTDTFAWRAPDSAGLYQFSIIITSYKRVLYAGHLHQIPVDTTDVELEVTVDSAINAINEPTNLEDRVTVFPNPTPGLFTVSVTHPSVQEEIIIYNMLGEPVERAPLIGNNTDIELNGKPDGLYFYRIITENGSRVGEGKLIIAH